MFGLRRQSLSVFVLLVLLLASCQNELLTEINQYYQKNVTDEELRPLELNQSGLAIGDLSLRTVLPGGKLITWDTTEHGGIDSLGALVQPSFGNSDITADIIALIQYKNGRTTEHRYTITVPAMAANDVQAVATASAVLRVGYQPGDSSSSVTQNLSLLTTGLHGTTINWDASRLSTVTDSGVVSRPSFTEGSQTGFLRATVSRGAESVVLDFPQTILALSPTDLESVTAAASALTIGYQTGDTASSVTGNLSLPVTGLYETLVSWDARGLSSVTDAGVVTRPSFSSGHESGTLIASVSKGSETATMNFTLTIIKRAITDQESVVAASASVAIGYQSGDSASSVTGNLTLPTTGLHGTTLSWDASALSSVDNSGTVTRPSYSSGNESGNLVVTVSKGSEIQRRNFSITVLRRALTDAESVQLVVNDIASYVDVEDGDSLSRITQNITLKTVGDYGTTISWNTDGHSNIGSGGTVSRESQLWWLPAETNIQGILVATVTKNTATQNVNVGAIVRSETVISAPQPTGFRTTVNGRGGITYRYLRFNYTGDFESFSDYHIEYRVRTGSFHGAWQRLNSYSRRELNRNTSNVGFGWTTAALASGSYQFRVRYVRNSQTGPWAETVVYSSF